MHSHTYMRTRAFNKWARLTRHVPCELRFTIIACTNRTWWYQLTKMALVELVRLRESSVKGHHIYQTVLLVGEVLICERELRNCHSDWAIVVKKPETTEVAGHVSDDLAHVLFPLLTAGKYFL